MLCVAILEEKGEISDVQWNFLLRGPVGAKVELPEKPNYPLITDAMWLSTNFLAANIPEFDQLPQEIVHVISVSISDFKQDISVTPNMKKSTKNWNVILDDFNKLLLLKTLKEEKLVFAITEYVKVKLGQEFIESPQVSLQVL